MNVKVWKNLVRVQIRFLWGGVNDGSKMFVNLRVNVTWGVKDLHLVNLAHLAKLR